MTVLQVQLFDSEDKLIVRRKIMRNGAGNGLSAKSKKNRY